MKGHGLHRKKAIHMKFRHITRVRRLFWRVSDLLDRVSKEKKVLL